MKLLILSAALAGMAFASPWSHIPSGPTVNGEESPIQVGPTIVDESGSILVGPASPVEPNPFSTRNGNVAQTGTITNSGGVGRDLIQYVINVNQVNIGNLWRMADEISENGDDLEYRPVVQTTTLTNSLAIRDSLVQQIRHDSGLRSRIANIIVDSIAMDGEEPISVGSHVTGQSSTITNSAAVSFNQYVLHKNGLHVNEKERFGDQTSLNGNLASISVSETNPSSLRRDNVDQTGTITNSGSVVRDLTQYVINMDRLNIDNIGRMVEGVSVSGIEKFKNP